ncbi:unnamed protein product [Chrysoparadoxa australica]
MGMKERANQTPATSRASSFCSSSSIDQLEWQSCTSTASSEAQDEDSGLPYKRIYSSTHLAPAVSIDEDQVPMVSYFYDLEAAERREPEWEQLNSQACFSMRTYELQLGTETAVRAISKLGLPTPEPNLTGTVSISIAVHISGYRVKKVDSKKHCEYAVALCCGGKRWIRWRRHSDFRHLSKLCTKDQHPGAYQAWEAVRKRQPAFRCLSESYLAEKCFLLGEFLKMVMFDIESPSLLLSFLL